MKRIISFVCLCFAVEAEIGRHVFINRGKNWTDAQAYCRQHHTDLSYFNSQREIAKLPRTGAGKLRNGWIGLERDPNDLDAWMWSGGGRITYQRWADGEPNSPNNNEKNAFIVSNGQWKDHGVQNKYRFYCVDVDVVEEKKSWEEALIHCRDKQTDLPSLISETDRLLARTQIRRTENATERVWIGLRFLGDGWMWVNGDALEYQAWSRGGGPDHQCPLWKRCGALTKGGRWENWDCQDKLNFICV